MEDLVRTFKSKAVIPEKSPPPQCPADIIALLWKTRNETMNTIELIGKMKVVQPAIDIKQKLAQLQEALRRVEDRLVLHFSDVCPNYDMMCILYVFLYHKELVPFMCQHMDEIMKIWVTNKPPEEDIEAWSNICFCMAIAYNEHPFLHEDYWTRFPVMRTLPCSKLIGCGCAMMGNEDTTFDELRRTDGSSLHDCILYSALGGQNGLLMKLVNIEGDHHNVEGDHRSWKGDHRSGKEDYRSGKEDYRSGKEDYRSGEVDYPSVDLIMVTAASANQIETVKLCMDKLGGKDINPILLQAANDGLLELAQFCLNRYHPTNVKDAIQAATMKNHKEIVDMLSDRTHPRFSIAKG